MEKEKKEPLRKFKDCICKKHGPYKAIVLEVYGATIESNCPKCQDEKEIKNGLGSSHSSFDFKAMNIEPEYYRATLENYITEDPTQQQALNAVKKLIKGELYNVVLIGLTNGTGKTHLASAAVKECKGVIHSLFEILVLLRQQYNGSNKEYSVLKYLCSVSLLVIDEIDKVKMTEYAVSVLNHIIDKRKSRFLKTMIIGNCGRKRTCQKDCSCCENPDCIESFLNNAMITRLKARGDVIEVFGKNRRI